MVLTSYVLFSILCINVMIWTCCAGFVCAWCVFFHLCVSDVHFRGWVCDASYRQLQIKYPASLYSRCQIVFDTIRVDGFVSLLHPFAYMCFCSSTDPTLFLLELSSVGNLRASSPQATQPPASLSPASTKPWTFSVSLYQCQSVRLRLCLNPKILAYF